jgi:hypothetical protein
MRRGGGQCMPNAERIRRTQVVDALGTKTFKDGEFVIRQVSRAGG